MRKKLKNIISRNAIVFFVRLWKETLSFSIISLPLTVLFIKLNWSVSQISLWTLILCTVYILLTTFLKLEKFFCYELCIFCIFPYVKTFVFVAILFTLRQLKETRILRGTQDFTRSALLTDLGFEPQKKRSPIKTYAWLGVVIAWLNLLVRTLGLLYAAWSIWIVFFLFAIGYAIHLTMLQGKNQPAVGLSKG